MQKTKTKRIEVTLEIDIPEEWTIGDTDVFITRSLDQHHDEWESRCEVGMQRSVHAPRPGFKRVAK